MSIDALKGESELPSISAEERTIVAGARGNLGLSSLWRHRELLWILTRRQIAVRYRQMALGIFWALFEPLAFIAIMTVVFGSLLRVDTHGYPYPIFVFAGLMPWLLFSKAAASAASSLVDNMALISKVYFPRLLLPVVAVVRELFDSIMVLIILIVMAWAFGFAPALKLLLAPVVLVYVAICALTLGLWLACVMVPFRDVRPLLALLLQVGMYVAPVVYPSSLVPAHLLGYYQLNPMYWPIEAFRWLLLDKPIVLSLSCWISVLVTAVLLLTGLLVFAAGEKKVVDVQ